MSVVIVQDRTNRLTAFRRGTLSKSSGSSVFDTVTTASSSRSWTLDAQGNSSANPSGNTYAVNKENQYTSITGNSGSGSGTTSLNFTYDNDGNLTTRPDSAKPQLKTTPMQHPSIHQPNASS